MMESELMKFQVVDYYDVWGNETDGWDVNGVSREDYYIDLVFDNTDDEIIEKLVEVRYLSVDAVDHVNVDWLDDTMIELTVKEDGFPLGRLEKVLN